MWIGGLSKWLHWGMGTDLSRRHDLDWLRFIAILILLFFHTGMWFNEWGWHVKNNETSTTFQYWMVWSHYFRMPLLLFISGAGTYMALGKRTPRQFANERFRRLFIPLLFGMFVIVPPQIYFEFIDKYANYWQFYQTVFELVPYPKGSLSWHHLWFILYLFLYSLMAIPLLRFVRSPRSDRFKEKLRKITSRPFYLFMLPSGLSFITQILLRPIFPDETHDLTDLAFFVLYGSFFWFGIIAYSDSKVWLSIGNSRRNMLLATIMLLVPFYGIYLGFRKWYTLPLDPETAEIVFDIIAHFLSWSTVLTIMGYGQANLNKPHPWLSKINEGLYPFYILHQTVIIWIGYYVCQWNWSISAKYWTICLLTLISCLGVYFLLIRPIPVLRVLFGMKPKSVDK